MFTAEPTTVWPDHFCRRCHMRVVIPPVVVEGRICRIIAAVDSLLEVEEWAGAWWLPSTVPLGEAGSAPQATAQQLTDAGVPSSDWLADAPGPDEPSIEARLRAAEPEHRTHTLIEDDVFVRVPQAWPRSYPGNVRFRRGTLSPRTVASRDRSVDAATGRPGTVRCAVAPTFPATRRADATIGADASRTSGYVAVTTPRLRHGRNIAVGC